MTKPEAFRDFVELRHSTAECDEGPEILMRPGLLTVRYDAETDTGRTWTTLRFLGAVALRVVPEPAVSPTLARAYSKVALIENSTWLAGFADTSGDGRLPGDLRHFVVFFDHYGSVETIARSCDVQEQNA